MLNANRPHGKIRVDLNLFPIPVVQVACYTLLPRIEFDLAEPAEGHMEITVWPIEGAELSVEAGLELLRRELTAAAFQRQAHTDAKEIRLLFAAAAFAPDIPQEALVGRLSESVTPLPEVTPDLLAEGRGLIAAREELGEAYRYRLAPSCPPPVLLRALSRMHDTSTAVVEGIGEDGGITFRVSLGSGTALDWWEEQFAALLVLCREGGLPGIYPPVHSLERSYIHLDRGVADMVPSAEDALG